MAVWYTFSKPVLRRHVHCAFMRSALLHRPPIMPTTACHQISRFLGLTRQNLMTQSFKCLLWGEGATGLLVYRILLCYWESTPQEDVRRLS
jgi:hypothetical protein